MARAKKAPVSSSASNGSANEPRTLSIVHGGHSSFESLDEQIRQRAYELYEQRGRYDGFADEDWLRAEAEVRSRQQKRSA